MKLRNKKTGEVKEFNEIFLTKTVKETNTATSEYVERSYCKIAELNEEWEDYKPAEPLIKDAGMREVMRLWAKVNLIPSNATTIEYQLADTLTGTETEFWDNNLHIMFYGDIAPDAVHGKIYTIAELCGEGEE